MPLATEYPLSGTSIRLLRARTDRPNARPSGHELVVTTSGATGSWRPASTLDVEAGRHGLHRRPA